MPLETASEAAPRTDEACMAPLPGASCRVPLPVAASYSHAGNHCWKLGSTVKIGAARDAWWDAAGASEESP